MKEDKFENLFKDFNPELTPDAQFIARLQHTLDAVELVKQQNTAQHKQYTIAVAVAAVASFAAGMLCAQFAPAISAWFAALQSSLPDLFARTIALSGHTTGWFVAAIASVFTALCAYELTLAGISAKR